MTNGTNTPSENYLQKFSEADWQSALEALLPSIHEVDRNAVQIWFRFYPLSLHQYLASTENADETKKAMAMLGEFGLENRIDSSHYFLYGHRYWKVVKAAIEAEVQVFANESIVLSEEIRQIAAMAAERLGVDVSLVLAITAAGFMTLRQVGLDKFTASLGETTK